MQNDLKQRTLASFFIFLQKSSANDWHFLNKAGTGELVDITDQEATVISVHSNLKCEDGLEVYSDFA